MTTNPITDKKIEIYSTPSCHFCHMEKDYLNAKGIPFIDYNVAEDMERRKHMLELTGQMGVPVTVITDPAKPDEPDVFIGFSEYMMDAKLGLNDGMKLAA